MSKEYNNSEFIAQIADCTLEHLKIRTCLSWKEWTIQCVGADVPREGTKEEIYWKRERLEWKNQVNQEFAKRNLTARMFILNPGEDIYLVEDKKTIIEMGKNTVKKIIRTHKRQQNLLDTLSVAFDNPTDQRMLQRLVAKSETFQNDFVGSITRMKLPSEIKRMALIESGMIDKDELNEV